MSMSLLITIELIIKVIIQVGQVIKSVQSPQTNIFDKINKYINS